MIKVGDIVVPSEMNAEKFDDPIPRYKICQIGLGRIFAENLITHENVCLHEDMTGDYSDFYYYYDLEDGE
jgi:hypothetical protein